MNLVLERDKWFFFSFVAKQLIYLITIPDSRELMTNIWCARKELFKMFHLSDKPLSNSHVYHQHDTKKFLIYQ